MNKHQSFYDTVDGIINYGVDKGILHLYTGNESFNGISVTINGKAVLNFGSCSYLGLEFDERLKIAAKEAIDKYGTQFSESRAYVSIGLYEKLQHLLNKIFNAHCVITPTTTLGHIANIPVMVEDGDAVILDQQVHNSVQTAVQIVKARGVHIELIRHNRMDLLETKIQDLRSGHKKIWYMADGIYSMFGDSAPVAEIYALMDKYPELHFYVDDAHGMSIHGEHGRGYVLKSCAIHPKMVMATSLNKAYASGGGVLVYGDPAMAKKVGNVGGPLLSSGPMQPSGLGAAIASAQIHLSDEILLMQEQLQENLKYTAMLLKKYKLPVISQAGAAIFFVAVSLPKLGHKLVRRMLDAGFYVNLGIFPTVPMRQTGVRFTITRLHTFRQIESMISTLAAEFHPAMEEENITLPEIYKAFKVPMPEEITLENSVDSAINQSLLLKLFCPASIKEIDRREWNDIFENKGTFSWHGLQLMEDTFCGNDLPEDNWKFDYAIVRDLQGKIIAATFLTTALWKDDMLSPVYVSERIEEKRITDPYYLTGKVICSGSLISEGEHFYLDKTAPLWKDAARMIFEKMYGLLDEYKANHMLIRDFTGIDEAVDNLMLDNGFFRFGMPLSHTISTAGRTTPQEFYDSLSLRSKTQIRASVLRNENLFNVEVISNPVDEDELKYWYSLYLNVKNKSLGLNTFALPFKFFGAMNRSTEWEVIRLTLKENPVTGSKRACGILFCCKTPKAYIPMIIGLDYRFNKDFNIYRQSLYQVILRANYLGKEKIMMGFAADTEKKKMGAVSSETYAYMHSTDTFNMETIMAMPLKTKFNNDVTKM